MHTDRHIIDLKRIEEEPVKKSYYMPAPVPEKRSFLSFGMIVRLALLSAALFVSGIIFLTHQQSAPVPSSSIVGTGIQSDAITSSKQPESIVEKVGNLTPLPHDEIPTIAVVKDLKPLKGLPFFADARVGDYVLIYVSASRAILYRPSTDKIIEVGPVAQ